MSGERIEAEMSVPSSTTVSATNSGGGPSTVTASSGVTFISALCSDVQTALNLSRPPAFGSWSVSFSSGLVTIDCSSGAVVTKTGGSGVAWDAGVSSVESISGDGYIEFTASELVKSRKVGFAVAAIGVDHTLIKWGLYLKADNVIYTTELGIETSTGASYAAGDTLTIKRTGTTVTYLRNGSPIATSATASSGTLVVGVAAFSASATVHAIRLYSAGVRSTLTLSASSSNVTVTATTYSITWTSTTLRDVFGFAANIAAVNAPQTGTSQAKGVWYPGRALAADTDPKQAIKGDDRSASRAPTGRVYSMGTTEYYRQRNVRFPFVPKTSVWAAEATLIGSDWETFYLETQGGHHSWFELGSRVVVYWDNAGVLATLGGGGVESWWMPECTKLDELQLSIPGFAGYVNITLGDLYSDG